MVVVVFEHTASASLADNDNNQSEEAIAFVDQTNNDDAHSNCGFQMGLLLLESQMIEDGSFCIGLVVDKDKDKAQDNNKSG